MIGQTPTKRGETVGQVLLNCTPLGSTLIGHRSRPGSAHHVARSGCSSGGGAGARAREEGQKRRKNGRFFFGGYAGNGIVSGQVDNITAPSIYTVDDW